MKTELKSFLHSREPAAQLAEIEAAIRDAEAELAQHKARRGSLALGALEGEPTAIKARQAAEAEIAALETRLVDLRDAAQAAQQRAAEAAGRAQLDADHARQREIAEAAGAYIARAARIDALMGEAADEMRTLIATVPRLGGLASGEAVRVLAGPHVLDRTQAGFTATFALNPHGGQSAQNNMLRLEPRRTGAAFLRRFADIEAQLIDDTIGLYPSEAEAAAAVLRLAARGEQRVAAQLCPGVWHLKTVRREAA